MKNVVLVLNRIVVIGYKILRNLGGVCLTCIFLAITVGIFTRYVLNSPITWSEELCCFMMVHLCFISAAVTTVKKKHIVADFFISKAPPKMQKTVGYIGMILELVFFAMVFYSVIQLLPTLVFKSPVLRIPRHVYYLSALVCSAFMFLTVVVFILNGFSPEYDLIKQMNEQQEEEAKKIEAIEAEKLQSNMDKFMEEAGYSSKQEKQQSGGRGEHK